jgi:hypothetical protein
MALLVESESFTSAMNQLIDHISPLANVISALDLECECRSAVTNRN